MKFGTRLDFGLLNSNLLGAETIYQWGRHIGRFKMAATEKKKNPHICRDTLANILQSSSFDSNFLFFSLISGTESTMKS